MDNNQQTNIIDNINVGFNSEENIEKVIRELDEAGIKYEIFRHAPVFTVEEANALGLPNPEAGAKNLFLRDNKKKLYCLVVVKDDREVKIKEIQEKINSRPLSFASEKDLFEKMKLIRGSVTPLGAINNEEKDVEIYIDSVFEGKIISVHPNSNEATIFLNVEDLVKFLRIKGSKTEYISFT